MLLLAIFILFTLGIFAIVLEVVLPYGISSVVGVALLVAAGYVAFAEYGLASGLLYCVIAITAAILVVRFVVRTSLRKMVLRPYRRSRTHSNIKTERSRPTEEPASGDGATVVQPLRPTGTIEWKGRRLSARTVTPEAEVPVGARVTIRSRDSTFWVVEHASSDAADR